MYQQLKCASLALALGSVCFGAFAQQKTIKGTVKDSNGEPMIGVSVVPDGGQVLALSLIWMVISLSVALNHLLFSNSLISDIRKRKSR